MHDRLSALLAQIGPPAAFATRSAVSPEDLRLEVKGVGPIRLPVTRARALKLCRVARPARYGLQNRTLLDHTVRDTWEIPKSRVKIDQRRWKQTLLPQLQQIRRDLGLAEDCRLRADLHNLLVYEPGQFFVAHQDTEKTADMIGSLIVVLPSDHRGGAIVVEHHDEKVTFRGSREKLTVIAFYADCHHQVRPVKEGYRVVLTYNLSLEGDTAAASVPANGDRGDSLARAVREYFETPPSSSWGGEPAPPDRLVYLLDHQYTQRGLDWRRLKNADGARAAELQEVARRLDCEIFLALAEVHETWSCEDEHYRGSWGSRYYDDEEEDEDVLSHTPTLDELYDTEIQLRHFVGAGKRPQGAWDVGEDEVCYTKPSVDLEPFESEHEPYMGNWGNTVDHWYHRAAVVLWPRDRSFVLRARASAPWAIGEIAKTLKSGDGDEARSLAEQTLPFWPHAAYREPGRAFFVTALRVAQQLESPDLATSFLQPFTLERLTPHDAPRLLGLLDAYGLEWCRALLGQWASRNTFDTWEERPSWLVSLPDLCRGLCEDDATAGKKMTRWLVGERWRWWMARWEERRDLPDPEAALDALRTTSKPFLGLLESSLVVGSRDFHRRMLRFLISAADGPVLAVAHLLRTGHRAFSRTGLAGLGLGELHGRCVEELKARLETPPRAKDDWSIPPPDRCRCPLCKQLHRFLADPERLRFEWPLAKQKRRHIHGIIDTHALPVTHGTRRTGSPYTLVLEKTQALFEAEAAERRAWRRELTWMTKTRRSFRRTIS